MNENKGSKEKLAENKLTILYLLSKVNCTLSNLQILRLLYDFDEFNYYYFQHLLSDLVEKNYIAYYKQEEEWLYEITDAGREILELTGDLLPGIKKYKLDVITRDLLQEVQNEVSITAEYIPDSSNDYITRCKISEAHKTLFEINVYCGTQEQAKKIAENWRNHANDFYPEIIKILTK